jgi:hypothetical protein
VLDLQAPHTCKVASTFADEQQFTAAHLNVQGSRQAAHFGPWQ